MEKLYVDTKKCKGCLICVNVCPREAIYYSGMINEKGYKMIAVDETKCIKCGSCYRMCPDYVFEIKE